MFLVGSGGIHSFGIHRQLPKKWTQRYSEEVPEIDETNLFVVEEPRVNWVTIQFVSYFFPPGERILQGGGRELRNFVNFRVFSRSVVWN